MSAHNKGWLDLPEGFEFRVLETDEDLEEVIEFNGKVHDEGAAEFLRRLIDNLPDFERKHNYFIRDLDKGIIVSAANEIPSIWDYDGIPIRNLELGFVGTLEKYRNRGFVRNLYSFFDRHLHQDEYDISVIQGIPYYYRQFGYDSVIPLMQFTILRANQIPRLKDEETPPYMTLTVRDATQNDIDSLIFHSDIMVQKLLVTVRRDRPLWEIQERTKKEEGDDFQTLIIENGDKVEGFFRIVNHIDQDYVTVIESSIFTIDAVKRALQYLRQHSVDIGVTMILLPGTKESNLTRIGLDLGGYTNRGWRFQVRLPNVTRFLNKIRPVLESRLHGTMYDGLTRDLFVNTFRHCYHLQFENGTLNPIEDIGMPSPSDKMEFRSPPLDFVRLIFGAFDISELESSNMDFIARGPVRSLLTTLFPKRESQIFYYFC